MSRTIDKMAGQTAQAARLSGLRQFDTESEFLGNIDVFQGSGSRTSRLDLITSTSAFMYLKTLGARGCKRLQPVAEIIILDERCGWNEAECEHLSG